MVKCSTRIATFYSPNILQSQFYYLQFIDMETENWSVQLLPQSPSSSSVQNCDLEAQDSWPWPVSSFTPEKNRDLYVVYL